jgi:branched-chain amino acid transport system permease protein
VQRIFLKPVEKAPVLTNVIVFIGLLVIFNSMSGWIFDHTIKAFPSPFPKTEGLPGVASTWAATSSARCWSRWWCWSLFAFFRFTPLGLAMRAAAQNPDSAALVGIRVSWMLALGWGLAASRSAASPA